MSTLDRMLEVTRTNRQYAERPSAVSANMILEDATPSDRGCFPILSEYRLRLTIDSCFRANNAEYDKARENAKKHLKHILYRNIKGYAHELLQLGLDDDATRIVLDMITEME